MKTELHVHVRVIDVFDVPQEAATEGHVQVSIRCARQCASGHGA
jgi:hypothetical protein